MTTYAAPASAPPAAGREVWEETGGLDVKVSIFAGKILSEKPFQISFTIKCQKRHQRPSNRPTSSLNDPDRQNKAKKNPVDSRKFIFAKTDTLTTRTARTSLDSFTSITQAHTCRPSPPSLASTARLWPVLRVTSLQW